MSTSGTPTIRNLRRPNSIPLGESERLAFPKMIAPAFLNRWTTPESLATVDPSSAYDPHAVFSLSLVPILSFNSMGIPCNSPKDRWPWSFAAATTACLSRSASSAWLSAPGFTSSTLQSRGFKASIWSRYKSTSCLEVVGFRRRRGGCRRWWLRWFWIVSRWLGWRRW